MVRNKVKNREKTPFLVGLWLRVRAKIEKNTLFGTTLVRIKSEIEKNTLFGRALVRTSGKNREKHPFWYELWLG